MKFWLYLLIGVVCLQTQSVMANENNDTDLFIYVTNDRFEVVETTDGKKKVEPPYVAYGYKVNTAALMSTAFGPEKGPAPNRRTVITNIFQGITIGDFQTSMLTVLKNFGLSNLTSDQFVKNIPDFDKCSPYGFGSMDSIIVLLRADVEQGPFSSLIKQCTEKDKMRLVSIVDSADWVETFSATVAKGAKVRDFAKLFSPPLTEDKTEAFFSFGVTDGSSLEEAYNRMMIENFTQATDINEDDLLDFLRHEAAGKKEGLSARAYKDKKRAEKIAAQKRAEERAKKMTAAREKIQIMPVAVCIGAAKDGHTKTLVNLFNTNNRPATVQYMLDAGCSNLWSTKLRGGDLKEFYRYRGYVGVRTREYMSGVGWIYAVVKKSEWDVPVN